MKNSILKLLAVAVFLCGISIIVLYQSGNLSLSSNLGSDSSPFQNQEFTAQIKDQPLDSFPADYSPGMHQLEEQLAISQEKEKELQRLEEAYRLYKKQISEKKNYTIAEYYDIAHSDFATFFPFDQYQFDQASLLFWKDTVQIEIDKTRLALTKSIILRPPKVSFPNSENFIQLQRDEVQKIKEAFEK